MSLDVQSQSLRDLASFSVTRISTPSIDDKPTLPSIGLEISRPPSTSSQASSYYPPRRPSPNPSLQLPALRQLSALASIASSTPPESPQSNGHIHIPTTLSPAMNFSPTPAATVGPGGQAPVCGNCGTTYTPLWRRDENGAVLCNACGLFLKLHGRPRPISLKTDVIKSRNRVKANQAGRKRAAGDNTSLPAAHPDAATAAAIEAARRASAPQQLTSGASDRSQSPISRTVTPGVHQNLHPSNIAPQSMFDSVTLDHQSFYSPSIPQNPFRATSPSASSATGNGIIHLEPPQTVEARKALQTRISELEVINSLFSGRVQELELGVDEAKRKEDAAREAERKAQVELEQALSREADLKQRVEELEAELTELREGPRTKKMRLSDLVEDGSQASTPLSSAS